MIDLDWEFFILRCLQIGMRPAQIADCLYVSRPKIYHVLTHLHRRYGVRRTRDLVAKVLEEAK